MTGKVAIEMVVTRPERRYSTTYGRVEAFPRVGRRPVAPDAIHDDVIKIEFDRARAAFVTAVLAKAAAKYVGAQLPTQAELEDRLRRVVTEVIESAAKLHDQPPLDEAKYAVDSHGNTVFQPLLSGQPAGPPRRLANFSAYILRDVHLDDGQERTLQLDVQAKIGGRVVDTKVTASQFASLGWVPESLGSGALIDPGQNNRDRLRYAIQKLSAGRGIVEQTTFTHTGWRTVEGLPVYLHAGGAICPTCPNCPIIDTHIDLGAGLENHRLPVPPEGHAAVAAVRACLDLRALVPRVMIPLQGAAYRAVLPIRNASMNMVLLGHTGNGKSALAALIQNHFGTVWEYDKLPETWASTANAIEKLAFQLKDMVLTIDDFVPTKALTSGGAQQMQDKAERILRGQGNGSGRRRMRRDLSLALPTPPRGMIIVTGEELPGGQSLVARQVVLTVDQAEVPFGDKLNAVQRAAADGVYATGTAVFIRWLAQNYDRVQAVAAGRLKQLRDQPADRGLHRRVPTNMADLQFGWDCFLMCARDLGAVTAAEADEIHGEVVAALRVTAAAQAEMLRVADPVQNFLRLVRSAVSSGQAHLVGPDGSEPGHAARYGWRPSGGSGIDAGMDIHGQPLGPEYVRPPGSSQIGWVSGAEVWLDPTAALAGTKTLALREGIGFTVSKTMLAKALYEQRLLQQVERERETLRYEVRKQAQGTSHRVWLLATETMFPTAEESFPETDVSFAESSGKSGKSADGPAAEVPSENKNGYTEAQIPLFSWVPA